jgi:uncharacterized protein
MDHVREFLAAVRRGDQGQVGALLDHDPALLKAQHDGASALLLALEHAALDVAELLLARGAPVGAFEAAALGRAERLRALVKADPALLAARGPHGATPLHLAARFGQRGAVEVLLAQGADPLAKDLHGRAPPALAAERGHAALADMLRTSPLLP